VQSAIHIVGNVGRQSYGLGAVALSLAQQQIALGCDSAIWCLDSPEDAEQARRSSHLAENRIRRFSPGSRAFPGYTPDMEKAARHAPPSSRPGVIHQHGIWSGLSRVTREWRSRHKAATVVAAHGALQPWALGKSGWKKRVALWAYERENLRAASCLHACGENEISDYREFKLKNPIALLPNAISACWVESTGDGAAFRSAHRLPAGARLMLYLARITPKKGLPMLLEAMEQLRAKLGPWVLVIGGPDEFGHRREIEAQVRARHLDPYVTFAGPLYGQNKRDAFSAVELFVLPTHSEGSPVAVLEALGAGVPVLTTKGAPWCDLVRHGCGWWADISPDSIYDALDEAIGWPAGELAAAGQRGRDLVKSNYNWVEIASRTIRLYAWIDGEGPRPDFVQLY
jgi:glycosyltransferase involved in cell wall biosynthesis